MSANSSLLFLHSFCLATRETNHCKCRAGGITFAISFPFLHNHYGVVLAGATKRSSLHMSPQIFVLIRLPISWQNCSRCTIDLGSTWSQCRLVLMTAAKCEHDSWPHLTSSSMSAERATGRSRG